MKKILRFLSFLVLVLILGAGLYGGYGFWMVQKPMSAASSKQVFIIEANTRSKTIFQNLEKQGLIHNANFAQLYAKINKIGNFKAGQFEVDKAWDLKTLITTLSDIKKAQSGLSKVSVIDGYWAKDIAKAVAVKTNVKEEDLLKLWKNKVWIQSIQRDYPFLTEDIFKASIRYSLEGYLSPATYSFDHNTSAEKVTKTLLNQSLKIYQKYESEFKKSSLSVSEVYTLASIIQYESGSKLEEGRVIAGIFLNRLKAKMPLGSSSSVCYAMNVERAKGDWKACEVNSNVDSPYNTYKNRGLPPGPINNPGEVAIQAALNPQETDYLFFMHDVKTGKVYYAKTYEEHQKNVKEHLNLKS
ncbi:MULTISPECIES: endolytic transglycosylase MltG [Terrabacteria group]|uniref:endolytic transglycosylase MltG n=1 Tax=Bacillati TaxID=1783272 RepID=UPI001939F974|nr:MULTISPECIES: endolytic transglycosylase MltG [Terrabacteria group]MBW9211847.1 endolytic transglycosylase MltG [Trueperella sp. zg.1013]QRG87349.1 endolytic transglycosylase MltG [Bulleidia sp. zg-1006]